LARVEDALKRNVHLEARSHFLAVLALDPATVLKIPEIPGLPFGRPESAPTARTRPEAPAAPGSKPEVSEEAPYVNPALAEAKEAFESGDYASALSTIDRFLGQNPRSTEATDLKRAVLLQQRKTLSEQNKLTDSFAALTQLAKLSS
jgi:hypothetical protein